MDKETGKLEKVKKDGRDLHLQNSLWREQHIIKWRNTWPNMIIIMNQKEIKYYHNFRKTLWISYISIGEEENGKKHFMGEWVELKLNNRLDLKLKTILLQPSLEILRIILTKGY